MKKDKHTHCETRLPSCCRVFPVSP